MTTRSSESVRGCERQLNNNFRQTYESLLRAHKKTLSVVAASVKALNELAAIPIPEFKVSGGEIQKGESLYPKMAPSPERDTVAMTPRPIIVTPATDGDLPEGERKVLNAIAQYEEGIDRDQLSVLTGYKRSTRNTYSQRLMGQGYVTEDRGRLKATREGVAALGHHFKPLPAGKELQAYWLRELPDGERKILQTLITEGQPVSREEIERLTGYKRSTRNTYIQRLMSRRVVDESHDGKIQLSPMLEEWDR